MRFWVLTVVEIPVFFFWLALKMEVVCSSKTLACNSKPIGYNKPEDQLSKYNS